MTFSSVIFINLAFMALCGFLLFNYFKSKIDQLQAQTPEPPPVEEEQDHFDASAAVEELADFFEKKFKKLKSSQEEKFSTMALKVGELMTLQEEKDQLFDEYKKQWLSFKSEQEVQNPAPVITEPLVKVASVDVPEEGFQKQTENQLLQIIEFSKKGQKRIENLNSLVTHLKSDIQLGYEKEVESLKKEMLGLRAMISRTQMKISEIKPAETH